MHESADFRRRLIKTLFCSSVAMNLNLSRNATAANVRPGSPSKISHSVTSAAAARPVRRRPGDGKIRGILEQGRRWAAPAGRQFLRPDARRREVQALADRILGAIPGEDLPAPCWAILGNHDYHDTAGNEQVQLGYAASLERKTRWTMPGKFYRVDFPQVTFLMLDTNWKSISGGGQGNRKPCLSDEEKATQQPGWRSSSPHPRTIHHRLRPPSALLGLQTRRHPIARDGAWPGAQKAGVHLYLCGHDHDLQHLEFDGLRTSFVISGGGGASLYPHGKPRKNSVVIETFGFSHLSISNERLIVRHIDPNGKVVHAFSKGVKHDWKVEA